MTETSPPPPILVAALYQFTHFDDVAAVKAALLPVCEEAGVQGSLLLAHEGVNGTIAGNDDGIAAVLAHLRTLPGCAALEVKYSRTDAMPFGRMKVRLKREIVTMGQPDLDPVDGVGAYVAPEDWNALIDDPDTILIDTRNDYEVALGTFAGAIDPGTRSFRDFPAWFRERRDALLEEGRAPKIAMFCTGGIRCEKATAFVRAEGIEDVFHLKGGILNYLEQVPEAETRWQGECFVFDERVSVTHDLTPTHRAMCKRCQRPLNDERGCGCAVEAKRDGWA
ncbi:rhodanese-related sulfurtransferase [Sphingomonas sp. RHCKR47]|uniref:oxygen-dependent tRNA uridine(34) hydroxylase TrhO n=1 Tax=Sphingomonas citricola TaxID=2862498 RepID=UPI001CA4B207|nr:rhodanese-related sulfurtransferase [Sphingomonas citricola]MBW6523132.1 rhodanese-related sulfurtransferase [Sphingomonas citricola]